MICARTSQNRSIGGAIVALALVCALAPGSATARSGGEEALSPRLQQLAEPGLRAAPPAAQAEGLSLAAEGAGSLLRRGRRILVDVRFEAGAAGALADLRGAGAQIVHVSDRYQTIAVAAVPGALPAVGAVPGVESVTEVLAPVTAATCPSGILSEGDAQLAAADARSAFAVDGAGVTVGILSDSFDQRPTAVTHAAEDVASGDLPGPGNPCGHPAPVNVLESFVPFEPGELPGDEGRAMAQIVHDLAPASTLAFASAFNGELAFAAAIERLARQPALGGAGARVIVDDVGYFAEPFFQNGPVGVAVDKVTAAGVSYFSAAGNDNLIDSGRDIASWEAPAYRPAACPASLVVASGATPPDSCMDFDPGAGSDNAFGIAVEKGETLTLDLQWAEAWNGVDSDLDAFLLDDSDELIEVDDGEGGEVPAGGYGNNIKSQRPAEVFQWENDTGADAEVRLVVARCAALCNPEATTGLTPRLKFVLLQSGVTAIEYPQSSGGDVVGPAIYGHAGAAGAIAAGAVRFNTTSAPEPYSSRGPVTHYFGPVSGAAAAAPIAPATIAKPDLVATDCGVTTFFFQPTPAIPPPFRFCGTSAAAPHAAAVAALIRQANPTASQAQVRTALTATARPVGAFGPNAVGAGLVDARAAVSALALPPTVTITKAPAPLGNVRRPTFEFSANRPVAFTCQLDGRAQPCASPFAAPAALGDGQHGFAVQATDLAGRVGSSGVASFAIDTTAPRTFFRKRPRKVIRTGKRRVWGTVAFGSNEAGVSFICKFDRDLPRYCPTRIKRRFEVGRHRIVVRARDTIGNVDRSAAVYKFRVEPRGKAKRKGR